MALADKDRSKRGGLRPWANRMVLVLAILSMGARQTMELDVPFTAGKLKQAQELFLKGNDFLQEQDFANAVLSYREALEADPKHADAWTNCEIPQLYFCNSKHSYCILML